MRTIARLERWPLAVRLIVLSLVVSLAGTSVGGWLLRERLHSAVERGFEQQLKDRQDTLLAELETDGIYATRGNRLGQGDFGRIFSGWYWVVQSGGRQYQSRSLWDGSLPLEQARDRHGDGRLWALSDPTGRPLLGHVRQLTLDGQVIRVHVYGPLDATLTEWRRIDRILLTTQLLLLASLVLLSVAAVRIGLSPLRRLQARLEQVHRGQSKDVGQGLGPDLDPIAATVDSVLERNRQMVERSRHQAADLSHTLKKPLAVLSIEARKANLPGPWLQEQVQAMSHTIDRHLARFGSGAGAIEYVPVQATIDRLVGLMTQIHRDKELLWDTRYEHGIAVPLQWQGVSSDLEEMLGNLLDNAGKWARQQVKVTSRVHETRLKIRVEDDGPGLPTAQLSIVVQRGKRFDESVPGHGLGLAIARDIAQTYNGQLYLHRSALGGLSICLELPLRA